MTNEQLDRLAAEHRLNLTAAEIRSYQAGERTLRRKVKPSRNWGAHSQLKVGMPWAFHPYQVWWHYPETDRVGHLQTSPFGQPGDRLDIRMKVAGMWMEYEIATVRAVRVEQIDGVWWWICELEELNAIDSRKDPIA